jgi:hypothetical protein
MILGAKLWSISIILQIQTLGQTDIPLKFHNLWEIINLLAILAAAAIWCFQMANKIQQKQIENTCLYRMLEMDHIVDPYLVWAHIRPAIQGWTILAFLQVLQYQYNTRKIKY